MNTHRKIVTKKGKRILADGVRAETGREAVRFKIILQVHRSFLQMSQIRETAGMWKRKKKRWLSVALGGMEKGQGRS